MYIRFIIDDADEDSGIELGIFRAAYELLEFDDVPAPVRADLLDAVAWFRTHLRKPRRLNRSRRPHAKEKAICWFKPSAAEHIAKARVIVDALQNCGVAVRMIKTDRPGYIVYQDDYQVAAEPFAGTL